MFKQKYQEEIDQLLLKITQLESDWKKLTGPNLEKPEWKIENDAKIELLKEKIRFFKNPTAVIYSVRFPRLSNIFPSITLFLLLGIIAYEYSTIRSINWELSLFAGCLIVLLFPMFFANERVIAKAYLEIKERFPMFPTSQINNIKGVIFSRSKSEIYFLKFSRFIQISFSLVIIAALGLALFSSLSAITLAPTTIIIFLLIAILLK